MQDEEFFRRLSAALRRSDDPAVEPIVAEAREAAVREATAILEALLTQSILERAVARLAALEPETPPAPPASAPPASRTSRASPVAPAPAPEPDPDIEPDEAPEWVWYVYGVQRTDAEPPAAEAGIVGAGVGCVEAEGLRAVVSRVRSADFGQPELIDHLDDLEWVGRNAHAHEAVLAAALAAGPVLPLRFGTVFGDRHAVAGVLRRHAGELLAELDRVTGRQEWGAKVLVDIDACDRWIARHTPGRGEPAKRPGTKEGGAYLARRQAQRGVRDERHRLLLEVSSEIHERLADLGVDAATDPPQQRQLSGHEGEMILNGAYLVDDDAVRDFQDAAAELAERHADKGVVVQTTGPWPPFHFISLPPLDELGETA